ncbi:MAG: FAD:protein FMN transferase [Lachnospiraceae bacterium]|nr:FAD:protein FMN transferase [Lachnospiraceae bacterium]
MAKKLISTVTAAMCAAVLLMSGCRKASEDENDKSAYTYAMGTLIQVRVIGENAQDKVYAAQQELARIDDLISYRTEGSLAESFNNGHETDMSEIADLLELSLSMSEETGGAFDITVLPLTETWQFDRMEEDGFDSESMTVPAEEDIQEALAKIGYEKLDFDEESGVLSCDEDGVRIEFGAAGKGYAIGKTVRLLKEQGADAALISAGSTIACFGTKDDGELWKIAVRDPRGEVSDYIALLSLTDTTVSTSGDYERYFVQDGVRYHHIVNSLTGFPADSGLMQVTIICEDCALGDALSTACFLLGLDEGISLANKYNVGAIFVDTDKNVWYNKNSVFSSLEFKGESSGYTLCEYSRQADN